MHTSLLRRILLMRSQRAFSLVEMAIVLLIVGLVLGGLLTPLATQVEQQRISETRKTLEMAKEALLLYAAANNRLPCPATLATNGTESFAVGGDSSNGTCSNFFDGYVPAVTLGLTPIDSQGYLVDGWGLSQNRIRYAVSNQSVVNITTSITVTNPFTKTDGMRSAGMSSIAATANLLLVCRANPAGIGCGSAANTLTLQAPIVLMSLGKNAPQGGLGADELQNLNPDSIFVSHEMSSKNAPAGEFDDIVTWFSINTLFARMMTAGALP